MRAPRRAAGFVAVLALVASLAIVPPGARCDDPHAAGPAPVRTPEAVAAEVRTAVAKGDADALRALAQVRVPSPYAVADELFGDVVASPPTRPDAGAALRAYASAAEGNVAAKGLFALVTRWFALTEEERARERHVREADGLVVAALLRMKFADAAEVGAAVRADAVAATWSLAAFRVLVNEAIANQRLGRLKVAEDSFSRGAAAAESAGHLGASAKAELEAALLARSRGDVALALERAERAQQRLEAAGSIDALRAQCLVARTLANVGRLDRASSVALDALAKAKARGDPGAEGEAWATLAEVRTALGDDREADAAWASEAALAEKSGSRERILRCLMNRASTLVSVRRYADAIEAFERALGEFGRKPYPRGESTAERNLAVVYGRLGRSDAALEHAGRALAAAETAKAADLIDEAGTVLAQALGANGKHEEALARHRRQVESRREAGDRIGAAVARTNVAWQLAGLRRIAEAIPEQEAALAELEAVGDRLGVDRARGQLADYLEVAGEFPRALELAQRVIDAGANVDPRGRNGLMGRRVLSRVLLRSGRLDEALAAARTLASEQRDATRGLDEEDAMGLRSDARASCEVGLRAALELLEQEPARAPAAASAAFELAESVRGLLLAEGLANASGLLTADLPPELVAADAESRRALEAARREALAPASPSAAVDPPRSAVEPLAEAWRRRDEVVERVQRASRRAATWVVPSAPDEAALRAALDDRTAFVTILGLDDRTLADLPVRACAIVVRRGGTRLVELPRAAEIEASIDAFLRVAATPGTDDVAAAAKAYDVLWRPVEAAVEGASRLVIVPDGSLSFVPFEALLRVADGTRVRLVERFEVSYAPSAGVWLALRAFAGVPPGDRILAVGDPSQAGPSAPPALPASALEAQDLADAVPAERRTLLLADAATVASVEAAARSGDTRFRAIHFACHGLVDPGRARGTGLLLANGEVLDVDRLARWRVAADVAVLSACDSGRGKVARAEGVFGLPRAFFLAGVPRVVVSQWVVYDKTTRPFMKRFYDGYLAGHRPVASALCEAKRAALKDGGPGAHPSAWAPFVLWGAGD